MSTPHPTYEMFAKNVAEHELQILRDDGIYRHLRVGKGKSSVMHYEIVTWPGYLAYVGDMGSFTFQRLEDMFQFFRKADEHKDRINPGYWSEKLEAIDRPDGFKEWSPEGFRSMIEYHLNDFIDGCEWSQEDKQALRDEVDFEILHYEEAQQFEAIEAVRNFNFERGECTFSFEIDEWYRCERYTFRFLWCCYAIVHAIKLYDTAKAPTQKAA
ncbi:MAG: hypothetical protein ACRCWJ_20505 [Casimicrobium sp.]